MSHHYISSKHIELVYTEISIVVGNKIINTTNWILF